jgi:GT2 family glycosyltransferase
MPLASIIIPNFNGKDLLGECLRSIRAQTYKNYEVLVVDDNSTDGAPEVVRKEYPWVVLIQTERIGFAQSCNRGIEAAKGEIIVTMLNNDMTVEKNWLKHLVAALNARGVGVVGGKIYNYGSTVIQDVGNWIDWNTGVSHQIGYGEQDRGQFDRLRQVDFVDVPAVRREVIDRIGGIDEEYSFYYTDSDFCVRAKKAGYKVVYVPAAVSWHRLSATMGRSMWRKPYLLYMDGMRFMIRHSPPGFIFYHVCRRTLFVLTRLTRSLFRRRIDMLSIHAVTYLWSLVNFRTAMRARRTLDA